MEIIDEIMHQCLVRRSNDFGIRGIKSFTLDCGGNELLYIFNLSGIPQKVTIQQKYIKELIGQTDIVNNELSIKSGYVACLLS